MSAESIISALDKLKDGVNSPKLVQAFVDKGAEIAQTEFGSMTTVETGTDSYKIKGTVAMIAEFGAGLTTDETHPYAGDMDFPVKVGSYSDARQGEFFKTGHKFWHFGKTRMDHVEPRRGMFHSMDYLKQHIGEIASEAFKNT